MYKPIAVLNFDCHTTIFSCTQDVENIYFDKTMSTSTNLITLFLHCTPYNRFNLSVANARASTCLFVHPSVKELVSVITCPCLKGL